MASAALTVCTYNIHKGLSQFNRKVVIHELRNQLQTLAADLVFLQEVQGLHLKHHHRLAEWPALPQHQYIADALCHEAVYGCNAVYRHGHHGNAILSRFPVRSAYNQDVSDHRFEKRGLLYSRISVHDDLPEIHCVCVHLGLIARSRERQMQRLIALLADLPDNAPLIIAGDFNDWRNQAKKLLVRPLNLQDVFEVYQQRPARSFPSRLPVLPLDRIYVRGFQVRNAQVHAWQRISDHAALSAQLVFAA